MKAKSLILILIALGCGSVAAVGATQVLESRRGGNVETQQILVAVTDIAIGKQFDETNVKLEQWPKDRIPPGAIGTLEKLEGMYARQRLFPGEPILQTKVMENMDMTTQSIPKGYRVISVKVAVDTSVAGLLKPGDKVDLIVFLRRGPEVPMTGTYRFLTNVTVFAVNAKTERDVDQEGKSLTAKTVSLLVDPAQAQKVALVSRLGSMHLSLRRPDDDTNDQDGLQGVTLTNLLTESEEANPDGKPAGPLAPMVSPLAPPVAPVFEEPKDSWTLQMITPGGVSEVHWSDTKGLPDQPSALPVSQIADPQAASADADANADVDADMDDSDVDRGDAGEINDTSDTTDRD